MNEDKKFLNAFALVGFVLGLLSVILYWVIGIVPALAIIFSIIGLVSVKKLEQKGKGLAITGLVLGIVYMLLFLTPVIVGYYNYFQENRKVESRQTNMNSLLYILQGRWVYNGTFELGTKPISNAYHEIQIGNNRWREYLTTEEYGERCMQFNGRIEIIDETHCWLYPEGGQDMYQLRRNDHNYDLYCTYNIENDTITIKGEKGETYTYQRAE